LEQVEPVSERPFIVEEGVETVLTLSMKYFAPGDT